MARGLIIEGVTGTGKTSTLGALARLEGRPGWLRDARVFPEEETLGDFMTEELRDPTLTDAERCHRLTRIMEVIEADTRAPGFVLERFHPSHFALLPKWELYAPIDEALARLGFRLVLLTIPEPLFRERSLHRREEEAWAGGMIDHFGSEALAMEAIIQSQRRRHDCLAWTRLPALVIDTSPMQWDAHAAEIAAFSA